MCPDPGGIRLQTFIASPDLTQAQHSDIVLTPSQMASQVQTQITQLKAWQATHD